MSDPNVVVLGGNLVRDSRVEYLPSSTPLARFTICNHRFVGRKGDGSSAVESYFFDCQWVSKDAQTLQHLMIQGRHLVVTGEVRQFTPQGQTFPRTYIKVTSVDLTPVADGAGQRTRPESASRPTAESPPQESSQAFQSAPRATPVPVSSTAQVSGGQHQRPAGGSNAAPAHRPLPSGNAAPAQARPAYRPASAASGQEPTGAQEDDDEWGFGRG